MIKSFLKHIAAWTAVGLIVFGSHYAFGKDNPCPRWEIQPPVLCEEAEHIFDSEHHRTVFISAHEAVQMCKNGTSVLWHWNGIDPHNIRKAWVPVSSYNVENAKIHFDCFVRDDWEACNAFTDKINEILDCWKEHNTE